MVVKNFYPVLKLNKNITLNFKNIVSSDVCGNIESGLENEIRLIDIEEHISDVVDIRHDQQPVCVRTECSALMKKQ